MKTKITEIIDNAIDWLQIVGITPELINLTEKDYQQLIREYKLQTKKGEDYYDGYIKDLTYYKGIEIDCRVLDEDEAKEIHSMLSESYICSSNRFVSISTFIPKETLEGRIKKIFVQKELGRAFNLRTLKEIL